MTLEIDSLAPAGRSLSITSLDPVSPARVLHTGRTPQSCEVWRRHRAGPRETAGFAAVGHDNSFTRELYPNTTL